MTIEIERESYRLLDLIPGDITDELTAQVLAASGEFRGWYLAECARLQTRGEEAETAKVADVLARVAENRRRAREALQVREASRVAVRPAVRGTAAQVLPFSAMMRCAPLVELPVAAGVGYELWEEVSDTWLRIPDEIPAGEYLALPVRGDSMAPVLNDGDTILVKVGARATPGSIVVARTEEDGYVVKYVEAVRGQGLRLLSLNPLYPPATPATDRAAIVGTVIARFAREVQ